MLKYILGFVLGFSLGSEEKRMERLMLHLDELDAQGVDVGLYLANMYVQTRPYLISCGVWEVGDYIVKKTAGKWTCAKSKRR